MILSLVFVNLLKVFSSETFGFPAFHLSKAVRLLPMAIGWWIYGISGVIALKYLNVPMFRYNCVSISIVLTKEFSAIRRFTTIIVMFGEWRLRDRIPPRKQQIAVVVMTFGAAVAGLTDITFNILGYLWVLVSFDNYFHIY
mmetsp:Transcript_26765/g.70280  ORF Transcript_26765/g.70280 Transcript_26765/m.70280 type:complete len:141 (-) Transcript_26765:961-1383(-)